MLSPNYQLYFFDTEFSMRGEHTELISLGITTLNDVNYYGVSSEFNLEGIDPWLETNVISKLPPKSSWIPRDTIKQEVQEYLIHTKESGKIALFVGWFCSYDWYLLCSLMGGMLNLPIAVSQCPIDIRQLCIMNNVKLRLEKPKEAHNALVDAKWTKNLYLAYLASI